MATYSINIGTPTESTKVENLQTFLNKLPDNTAQLISPRDTRDAIFTTWENILIKETTVASSSIGYIGLDTDTLKSKMLIGKKTYTTQEILDNTLLSSDTDLFIFNGKSDSNPSLQDTKVTLLAGLVPGDYYYAPYIEATKIALPSRIDLAIVNPATAGVIQINADQIELGTNGWVINNTGALYPVIDGQDLGATPSNRIGNIYMASRIDYGSDLSWTFNNTTNMVLTTLGILSLDTISASRVYTENLQITTSATAGYVLTSDGIGNADWLPVDIVSPGVTAGYIIVADGLGDTTWQENSASSAGASGSVQFSQGGLLTSDFNNFRWDNNNKRLGLLTNTPTVELDVVGSGSFSSNLTVGNSISVGGSINVANDITANDITANGANLSQFITFATAGFGVGKLLTSDSFGNATWEDAPITITSSGPLNSIQLSNGSGEFIYDTNFKWRTNYGNDVLNIGNTVDIGESYGYDGLHMDGSLFIEPNNVITFNAYFNGTWKRIGNSSSSWISQGASEFDINFSGTGITGSIISVPSTRFIRVVNSSGNVGLNITPVRRLHVNNTMRLEPTAIAPTASVALGDMYVNTTHTNLMVHNGTNWYKTVNRTLFNINANNMTTDAGTFNGLACSTTSSFALQDRWFMLAYADSGTARVSQFNFILPDDYISGRDIRVHMHWTLSGNFLSSVSILWRVGITNGSISYQASEGNTQYLTHTFNTGSPVVYSYEDIERTFTFNGASFVKGRPLSVIILRDNSDTYTGTVYLANVEVVMV